MGFQRMGDGEFYMDAHCISTVLNACIDGINCEKILYYDSNEIGMIIAIHNTKRGPALGGCRMINGTSKQLSEKYVCKLAKAMTFKNTVAGIPYGGGKCYIYRYEDKSHALCILSDLLNYLGGEYQTADDVGTSVEDMELLRRSTPYARGVLYKGKQIPATSIGVYQAIKAYADTLNLDLSTISVAIQGIGKVGYPLAKFLANAGCRIIINEINKERLMKLASEIPIEATDDFLSADVDILAPCALGDVFSENNVKRIKAQAIIGGANNQLCDDAVDFALYSQGITYIPDYLCNCGGVIDIDCEGEHYSPEYVSSRLSWIYSYTKNCINWSKIVNRPIFTLLNEQIISLLRL